MWRVPIARASGCRSASVSVRHYSSRNAARQNSSRAVVRSEAGVNRSWTRQVDGGCCRGPHSDPSRRGFCRVRRAHFLCGGTGDGAAAMTAKWETPKHPSSKTLFEYLREHARNGVPNPFTDQLAKAAKTLRQTYNVFVHPARANGTAHGGGGVGWRQAHGLDGHAESVRLQDEHRPGDEGRSGERAGDRSGLRRWIRREAHARRGARSGAPGEGGGQAGVVAMDPRRGIHLGLFPTGGGDRHRSGDGRRAQDDLVASHQHQLGR